MSTVAVATRPPPKEDTRNLAWRADNVGSKLLQRMGWKDGQAVGKRQRHLDSDFVDPNNNNTNTVVSSEGLRVVKRQDGLGLGAKVSTLYNMEQHHHVGHFSHLLAELRKHHSTNEGTTSDTDTKNSTNKKKVKKNKKKNKDSQKSTTVILPTNKSTHAKVRQAKFMEKSDHDMKCIFGGSIDFPTMSTTNSTSITTTTTDEEEEKKKKKESKKRKKNKIEKEEMEKKRKKKRQKKDE